MEALERKRYLRAVEMFQRVVSNFPGSALVAEAQFHLAEAYFGMEDFVNAVFEYQRLVDSYPHSDYVERAQFQIAESHFMQMRSPEHDQKETYEALTHFRRFIEDNPESPLLEEVRSRIVSCRSQLAKKQYLAGLFYQKQGYPEAARICYEDLLLTYPDTPLVLLGQGHARGDRPPRAGSRGSPRALERGHRGVRGGGVERQGRDLAG